MLFVLVGPSYSGKSTVCEFFKRYYKEQELPMYVICPDDIRKELLGDAGDQSNGKMIFETAYERVDKALNSPLNTVFFDATSLTPARRKPLIEIAKKHRVSCFAVVMPDFTEEELTARVATRERKVPLDVVRAQKQRMVYPTVEEGFDYTMEIPKSSLDIMKERLNDFTVDLQ